MGIFQLADNDFKLRILNGEFNRCIEHSRTPEQIFFFLLSLEEQTSLFTFERGVEKEGRKN